MAVSVNRNGLLAGKVAVVTGASRGIGEAIALRYAAEGATIVVSARTENEGDHQLAGSINGVVERIKAAGGEALGIRCDLSNMDDRVNLIRTTEDALGPIDILVNNAAVTFFIPVVDFPERRFRLMVEIGVYAPFHLSQLALPKMKERGSGWILNISSHAAIHPQLESRGGFGGGGTVYGLCKAALERFTTGLAAEVLRDGIGVNALSPGLVATPGVVYHGLATAAFRARETPVEQVAEACLRLVHGEPGTLTGRVTYVDRLFEEFKLAPAELIA